MQARCFQTTNQFFRHRIVSWTYWRRCICQRCTHRLKQGSHWYRVYVAFHCSHPLLSLRQKPAEYDTQIKCLSHAPSKQLLRSAWSRPASDIFLNCSQGSSKAFNNKLGHCRRILVSTFFFYVIFCRFVSSLSSIQIFTCNLSYGTWFATSQPFSWLDTSIIEPFSNMLFKKAPYLHQLKQLIMNQNMQKAPCDICRYWGFSGNAVGRAAVCWRVDQLRRGDFRFPKQSHFICTQGL